MKSILSKIFLAIALIGCTSQPNKKEEHNHNQHQSEQEVKEVKKPLSPHTSEMAMVGNAHIHIDYSSPGVRNRMIFGGLLAYDQVWQAGAHMATWIETNKALIIEGNELPAGKYGFFAIPSKEEWTLIFNKNWDQHGKDDYSSDEDVFRIKAKPVTFDSIQEHLKYEIEAIGKDQGSISLKWEKTAVSFNFKVK